MPPTAVVFYQTENGTVPVLKWLDSLPEKARVRCLVRIERLAELGHELRRPEADYLRDGIYELRAGFQGIHQRILYFFHGNTAAVLTHGIVKTRAIPPREMDRAIRRKVAFELDPERHTFKES